MRILLADNEPRIRFALRALLTQQQGVEVVGDAADAKDLMNQAKTTSPDVVLLHWTRSMCCPHYAAPAPSYTSSRSAPNQKRATHRSLPGQIPL
jgi:DNA-binding NarL/FixJ family response regulator